MDSQLKRFVAAMVETEHQGANQATTALKSGTSWDLRSYTHPIDGYPMAVAIGPYASPPIPRNQDASGRPSVREVDLVLTAVRTGADAASIEVSAGLDVYHNLATEYRAHVFEDADKGGGLLYTGKETAPANLGTAVARAKWNTAGTAPAVEAFRLDPVFGKEGELLIHFRGQMPTGWAAHSSIEYAEADESVLSTWTTAPAATDTLVLGIPWLVPERELVVSFRLHRLHTAVAELKALVAPPPPPADDDDGETSE